MTTKRDQAASRELLDFIRNFVVLCEKQIKAIRGVLNESVVDIMNNVEGISAAADMNIKKSDELLVKEIDENQESLFIKTTFQTVAEEEKNQLNKVIDRERKKQELVRNELRRASGKFSKQIEAISSIDDNIKNMLTCAMGAASVDDVVGQRMDHIIHTVKKFNELLSDVIRDYEGQLTIENIRLFKNRVLTSIYLAYTTEDEREIFHRIFGRPIKSEKVS